MAGVRLAYHRTGTPYPPIRARVILYPVIACRLCVVFIAILLLEKVERSSF